MELKQEKEKIKESFKDIIVDIEATKEKLKKTNENALK